MEPSAAVGDRLRKKPQEEEELKEAAAEFQMKYDLLHIH